MSNADKVVTYYCCFLILLSFNESTFDHVMEEAPKIVPAFLNCYFSLLFNYVELS